MSLQESSGTPSTVFEAKMAIRAHLPAQVTDAFMRISIQEHTDVLAEANPDGDVTILWSYGQGTAQAVVPRSFLHIPTGK